MSKKSAAPAAGARTIFRMAAPERPFTMICNAALRDTDLTPVQTAVLVFMISQPPTFRASLERVAELRGLGRDAVREAVLGSTKRRGLIGLGYCMRRRHRDPVSKRFGPWEYCFTDQRGAFSSSTDFPQDIHSDAGPAPENQGLEGGPRPGNHALESRAHIKNDQSNNTPPRKTVADRSRAVVPAAFEDTPIPFDAVESEQDGFSMGAPATDAPTTDHGTSPWAEHLATFGVHATLIAPAQEAAQEAGTAKGDTAEPLAESIAGRGWFPFSTAALVKVRRLSLDPEDVILRYLAGTRGQRIENPDAYLLRIAIDMAARKRGVPLATVAKEIRGYRASMAEQMAEAAIAPKVLARPSMALRALVAGNRGR